MAAKKSTNGFVIGITITSVVMVAIFVGVVVWLNSTATSPGEPPKAESVNQETGAISVGTGPVEVATYIDFMCPACNAFEQKYGDALTDLVDDGSITLNIHPIAILDSASQGTEYSTRAANALYCAAETAPESVVPFMQALFAGQPAERTPGLSDEEILGIASSAGVTGIDSCVADQTYDKFVTAMTAKTPVQPGAPGISTPTVSINGETISNTDLPADADNFASLLK